MKRLFTFMSIVSIVLLSTIASYAQTTNPLKGYEWLEGTWAAQNNGDWGEVIIDKSTSLVSR